MEVTVSGGVAYVPSLEGQPFTQAQDMLQAASLALSSEVTYVDTDNASLHNTIASQTPAADTAVIQGAKVTLTVYRVPSMLASARVILDLPQAEGLTAVRITLSTGSSEVTVYQGEFTANSSRHPEVELTAQEAGDYTYRVYFNEKFAYQHQVSLK